MKSGSDIISREDLESAGIRFVANLNSQKIIGKSSIYLIARGPAPQRLKINAPTNVNAADTTNAEQLQPGGSLGLDLTGAGITVGVWDGGYIRTTHQELIGRVTIGDSGGSPNESHATHVAGIIAASGVQAAAKGMATAVVIHSYDWNKDLTEMQNAPSNLNLSNHSYGSVSGWTIMNWGSGPTDTWLADRSINPTEDPSFGKYTNVSQSLDQILANKPNFLSVWSAGNDRYNRFSNRKGDNKYMTFLSSNPANAPWYSGPGYYLVPTSDYPAPLGDGNSGTGYDSLNGATKVAKNNLVIGAINDITADPYNNSNVIMSNFSNWGPTDDGRVKPDLVANGISLYSSVGTSNTAYSNFSGTSMAAPNATGTLALLSQHYQNLFTVVPRSDILKATAIHTAFDAGNVGPDYSHGWGVLDGAKAAQFLTSAQNNLPGTQLIQGTYNGSPLIYNINAFSGNPIKATLVWIDPPGNPQPGGLDVATPVLVRDLDLSITAGTSTFYPWTLDRNNPSAPAVRTARNKVDNVEQVVIDYPKTNTYTVEVGHSGSSFTGQNFALLISYGAVATPDVTVTVDPTTITEDGSTNLVYTFTRADDTSTALNNVNFTVGGTATFNSDYTQTGATTFNGTNGTINFPAGSATQTVTIDPTPDTLAEADETAILSLTDGTGYTVGSPNSATGTILNDDTNISVTVEPVSVTEDGSINLVYTFTRSGNTSTALNNVNFTVGGTATFNSDYTQTGAATFNRTGGTINFTEGSTTQTVTIDPTADTIAEPNETAILTVTNGTGYTVGSLKGATGTILNDDTNVSVTVSPVSVTEDGSTNLVYKFTRSGNTSTALNDVNFTVGGTAVFDNDYTQTGAATFNGTNGTINFAAGATTRTVTIDPTPDNLAEPNETAILTVTNGTGYTAGSPNRATGTILNDDTNVSVTVSPVSVTEDGSTNLIYKFTRSGNTSTALNDVSFTVGGTAVFDNDYTQTGATTFNGTNGTISFAAGATTRTVTIDPTPDTIAEADETAILTVTNGTGYTVGTPNAATGTIRNDDFNNSTTINIVDGNVVNPYPSTIDVSGTTGNITKVTATITGLSHTFPDDIDILLAGPNGRKTVLMSDAGGSFDLDNINLTFNQSATATPSDSNQIVTGTYRPINYESTIDTFPAPAPTDPHVTTLNTFNGMSANGVWNLFVVDDANLLDIGAIANGWELNIQTA